MLPTSAAVCDDAGMSRQWTITEAAAELGVSERALRDRIRAGSVQATQVHARLWLIDDEEIRRLTPGRLRPGRKPAHVPKNERDGSC